MLRLYCRVVVADASIVYGQPASARLVHRGSRAYRRHCFRRNRYRATSAVEASSHIAVARIEREPRWIIAVARDARCVFSGNRHEVSGGNKSRGNDRAVGLIVRSLRCVVAPSLGDNGRPGAPGNNSGATHISQLLLEARWTRATVGRFRMPGNRRCALPGCR